MLAGSVPAAVSTALRLVPPGPGTVIAAFPGAMYVRTDADFPAARAGGIVAVVAVDAMRLPCSVVLPHPTAARPFSGLTPGAPATIRTDGVDVGELHTTAARWWPPRIVCPTGFPAQYAEGARVLAEQLDRGDPLVAEAAGRLLEALVAHDGPAAQQAAAALVGLGPGLTPAGDDLLVGLLLGLRASSACVDLQEAVAGSARHAPERTTALASTLLACAVRGEAADVVADAVATVSTGHPSIAALHRLLEVGASSGQDLARGLVLAGAVAGAAAGVAVAVDRARAE